MAGALTVGMTYLLGRRLFGQAAGLVAAILLAGNAAHVLVSSHVAWSNCVTPLFTTTAFWLLLRALDRPGDLLRLGLAGLAWGLALQTHPSVIAFLVGAAIYALWRDPRLPLRPGAWLAVVLLVVGYGNVLAYNLGSGFDTLTQAQRVGSEYAGGAGLDAWGYVASVLGILMLIVHTTAGVVDPRMTAAEYLVDPRVLVALVGLVAALVWSVRRREPLLLCLAVPVVVLIPALNQRWSPILASRYIMPLVPLALVMVGGTDRGAGEPATGANPRRGVGAARSGWPGWSRWSSSAGSGSYYQTEIAAGRSNDGPWRMIRLVEEQRRSREPFVVHSDLHLLPTGGGGTWAKALDYLLELEDIRKDVSPRDAGCPAAGLRRDGGRCCGTSSATSGGGRPATSRATSGTGSRGRRRWPASGARSWGGSRWRCRTRCRGGTARCSIRAPRRSRPAASETRASRSRGWSPRWRSWRSGWPGRCWPALDAHVVQDDARQHVFWMQRLVDPSLLRDDLYADYFASQAPPGYVLLFRVLLLVADPLTASKLLPPVLGLVAAVFTFLLVERLYPSGVAAFLATVLGSWYVWQYDDLPTGSPRAFLLPLTAMLLYGLVAGWRWWAIVGGGGGSRRCSTRARRRWAWCWLASRLIRLDRLAAAAVARTGRRGGRPWRARSSACCCWRRPSSAARRSGRPWTPGRRARCRSSGRAAATPSSRRTRTSTGW